MEMKMPHGGTQGIGTGLVTRCFSWLEFFTKWEGSQVEALLMLAAILAGVLL